MRVSTISHLEGLVETALFNANKADVASQTNTADIMALNTQISPFEASSYRFVPADTPTLVLTATAPAGNYFIIGDATYTVSVDGKQLTAPYALDREAVVNITAEVTTDKELKTILRRI